MKKRHILRSQGFGLSGRASRLAGTAVMALGVVLAGVGLAQAKTVDCARGSLQTAINGARSGDVLSVQGTCSGKFVVPARLQDVTLDGQGSATLSGDPSDATLTIYGSGITVRNFASITGGLAGISVHNGAWANIESSTIQQNLGDGIDVGRNSFASIFGGVVVQNNTGPGILVYESSAARIFDNVTIQGNAGGGIGVQQNSHVRIGFFFVSAQGITIQNNAGGGIFVDRASAADIANNSIVNNTGDGVLVGENSHARIFNNTIQGNTVSGISLQDSSSARIGFDSIGTGPQGNTIQNNGGDGIVVGRGSAARIAANTISGNVMRGVVVFRNSRADIASNAINGNGSDGIGVFNASSANLGNSAGSGFLDLGNTTTTPPNTLFGINCDGGAYVAGHQGTVNGSSGPTSFTNGCVNNLIP